MGLSNNLGKLSNMITSTGSAVGIAQASPAYTLDVSGSLRSTTSAYFATTSGNIGIGTASPVSTNLVGSQTIVKSYNSDTPTSTTAQTYYTNQSNLYLFGRNAGLSIISNSTTEEGTIFFGNASTVAYASIATGSGTSSVGGDMYFKVGSNTERMRITSAGNVGIGTSSPSQKLEVSGTDNNNLIMSTSTTGAGGTIRIQANEAASYLVSNNARPLYIQTNSATAMTITSGGNVGIGTTSPDRRFTINSGASEGGFGLTSNNGVEIDMVGYGTGFTYPQARIKMTDAGNYGGNLAFWTKPNGAQANALVERMLITSAGEVLMHQTTFNSSLDGQFFGTSGDTYLTRPSNPVLYINRRTNDGVLIDFQRDNVSQGSISVAGGTVSYNSFLGSHWSQLQDGSKIEILKGTIIEAIDEMCVWQDETNDRLPKSKISDTLESKNVYGTFLAWDEDWETSNDFYVAAVGLGYIRVNSSQNISMGDLLQSNGDGTAKIQSDDIMRSSTIAKVVSTQKIETYEDGSYLIAATLHCG